MSTARFTENTELANVYKLYRDEYIQSHEGSNPWPMLENYHIIKAEDGAGVCFSPETALFGGKQIRERNGSIAKNIASCIIEAAAYYILNEENDVPKKLKISLAVCH